jgi:PEP-CTERM motif
MNISIKSLHVGFLAGAMLILVAAQANAQFSSNHFDNSSSFLLAANYNPPPIAIHFGYGGATVAGNNLVQWSPNDAASSASSGSVELSWVFNHPGDGDESAAFVMDINPDANTLYSNLSFDLMIGNGQSGYGSSTLGASGDYGYMDFFTLNNSYGGYYGDVDQSLTGTPGVWQHFSAALTGNQQAIRALVWQDYNDTGRNILGFETVYIDNLTLTQVPEPTSLALLGLAVPGLVVAARRYRNRKSA